MKRCRWHALGVVWAVALVPSVLAAAVPIEWEAPEGCPSTDVVHEKLADALGHETSELGAVSRVRGVIVAESAGYRLTLEVVDARRRSVRSFQAERCADLASAAALAVALALHPRSSAGGGAKNEAANTDARADGREGMDTPRGAQPVTSDRGPAGEVMESGRSQAPSWSAGANGVFDVGALPDPALGVGVQLRVGLAPLELDVHGFILPSQRIGVGDAESVELGLMAAGLRACLRVLNEALVVGACLGGEAGRLTATGVNLTPARRARDAWLAIGPAVVGRTQFAGPLQLEFLLEPLLPLARKEYAVDATQVVHSPSPVDLRAQMGLIFGWGGQAEAP